MQVIQTTGFLRGLYTEEELNSENIKDRDGKIAFLQKAIDVVSEFTVHSLSESISMIIMPKQINDLLLFQK